MREAIVLDCEMVTCGDHAEVAYLSAIDFLTGEVLTDSHVQPTSKVTKWNTHWSGVSVASMRKAHRDKKIIYGWQQARERLWKFANNETVLIGHALQNDLNILVSSTNRRFRNFDQLGSFPKLAQSEDLVSKGSCKRIYWP